MAISCCSKCSKLFEESLDGELPPICSPCYQEERYRQQQYEGRPYEHPMPPSGVGDAENLEISEGLSSSEET